MGRGDYTKERSQWISENLDEIFKEIKEKRTSVIAHRRQDRSCVQKCGGHASQRPFCENHNITASLKFLK